MGRPRAQVKSSEMYEYQPLGTWGDSGWRGVWVGGWVGWVGWWSVRVRSAGMYGRWAPGQEGGCKGEWVGQRK